MSVNRNAAVLGAFVADALSLGVHWVYNTGVIDKKIGRVERYTDPMTSYHEGKKAGDFTHYGDQTLVLLESVKAVGRFDPRHFAERWRTFFADYTGYFDKATKATLENMNAGQDLTQSGSTSDDLAGASRLAALLPAYPDAPASLIDAARAQTAITHTDDRVVASAEFFARTVAAVLAGQAPVAAIEAILRDPGADAPIAQMIEMGLESRRRDTREAIAEFGQMCSVTAGLPSTLSLVTPRTTKRPWWKT